MFGDTKMKIVYFEMRKTWLKLSAIIMLIALSVLNFIRFFEMYRYENEYVYRAERDAVCMRFQGEITPELIANFKAEKEKFTEENPTEYMKIMYYDLVQSEISAAATYENISNSIVENADCNVLFYAEHNNVSDEKRCRLISRLYRGRHISEYRKTDWVRPFFTYDFSSLAALILIITTLAASFAKERESGMDMMISSCGKSMQTVFAKLVSAMIYSAVLALWFTAEDLTAANAMFGIEGLSQPIYAAEIFANSPFSFSLFGAVVFTILVKFIAYFTFAAVILLISKLCGKSVISLCISFILCVMAIFFSSKYPSDLNPVNMLTPNLFLQKFETVYLFGIPIVKPYFVMFILAFEALIFSAAVFITDRCQRSLK